MPYINTIDINGVIYTLENLTDGNNIVTLPELSKDDIFVLQGNIVNNTSSTSTTQPLSAKQGKVLRDDLNAEIANREADVDLVENTLTTNLNAEIARSKKAEADELARAQAAEKVLTDNLAQEVTDRITAVSTEKSRAESAESTLTTNLNNEITRAKGAEQDLTDNLAKEITDRTNDVNEEETRAKSAEKVLTDNLSAEVTRATNKENEINVALTGEISRATGAENTLTSNLNAEILRAEGVESGLASRIATMEAFFKEANIDASKDFIDTLKEIQSYIASDKTGAAAMTASINANTAAIATEKSRAESAEGALQSNIDAEATTARAAEKANADAIAILNGTDNGSVAKAIADAKTELETEIDKKLDKSDRYVHPTYDVHESGLYKITVDEFGHISSVVVVSKDDIVALGIPAQDTTYEDATSDTSGLLSATDKDTYDGYAATITDLQSQIDALKALIESYHGVVEEPKEPQIQEP